MGETNGPRCACRSSASPVRALWVLVIGLSACSTPRRAPDAVALASYMQSWSDLELSQRHHWTEDGYRREVALIRSPLFGTLSNAEQRDRLRDATRFAYKYRDPCTGHELARRSTELAYPSASDWLMRAATAYWCGDQLDAVRTLTRMARDWPFELQNVSAELLWRIAQFTPRSPNENEAQFELLESLYRVHWTDDGVAPYDLWAKLAAELCEQGHVGRALEVARQVDSPRFVLWMRVDKRFDALVRQDPGAFDIDRAAARAVAAWTDAMSRYPRRLHPISQLAIALLDAGRYDDALRITGAALSRVRDAQNFKRVFDDDETEINWILDVRSQALQALQQWKEAEWELRAAADRLEYKDRNVSNVIDLAAFEADLGRADEALNIIADLRENTAEMTPYGHMQFYGVRLEAAVEKGDAALVEKCIRYMQAHQADALATYQVALVRADRSDQAAKLLIQRLNDPQTRREALLDVQLYSDQPAPPEVQRLRERWRGIVQRRDVRKAIARVGRVVDVALPGWLQE